MNGLPHQRHPALRVVGLVIKLGDTARFGLFGEIPDGFLSPVAKDALEAQQISGVKTVANALADGAPEHAPFDVIFVNGRLTDAPERLLGQLATGGRLVAVIGNETSAKATLFTKIDETIQSVIDFDSGGPVLPGFEKKVEFAF